MSTEKAPGQFDADTVYAVMVDGKRVSLASLAENAEHAARAKPGSVVVPCRLVPIAAHTAEAHPPRVTVEMVEQLREHYEQALASGRTLAQVRAALDAQPAAQEPNVDGLRRYPPSVAQKPYGVIIKALAGLLTAHRTDQQFDADVQPSDPVRAAVSTIRQSLDEVMTHVPKVGGSHGADAADASLWRTLVRRLNARPTPMLSRWKIVETSSMYGDDKDVDDWERQIMAIKEKS